MVKTHEIKLSTSQFNAFTNSDYIIVQASNINVNDYILFKQVETIDTVEKETGLFRMTQVTNVIQHDGLKTGYVLITVLKL